MGWAQQGVVEWVLLLVKEQQALVKRIVGVQLGLEWGTQLEVGWVGGLVRQLPQGLV